MRLIGWLNIQMVVDGDHRPVFVCHEFSDDHRMPGRLDFFGVSAKRTQVLHCGVGAALNVRSVAGFSADGWNFDPLLELRFEFGPNRFNVTIDIRFHVSACGW